MYATRIAVISCSSRQPRLNPYISKYVISTLKQNILELRTNIEIIHVDLGTPEFELPLSTAEPKVPAKLPKENPTPHYVSEKTRDWSALVSSFAGFIFVTPQYNWSYPATVKNAIDIIFHEWKGKAAGIVTYGQRGGAKAGDHLAQVLSGGMKMRLAGGPEGHVIPALEINEKTLEECEMLLQVPPSFVQTAKEQGAKEKLIDMGNHLVGMVCAPN